MDAAIRGSATPNVSEQLWEAALLRTRGGDPFAHLIDPFYQASAERLAHADSAAWARATAWLLACQQAMSRAEARAENHRIMQEQQFLYRDRVMLSQMVVASASVRQINWL
ncbi:MAG: hypothetical protein OHK0050_24810 [Roseiflexaceae bacterium]